MNHLSRGLAVSILTAGILAPKLLRAQDEYFRELGSPRQTAPVVQLNPQEEDKYNLAFGPLRFNVAAGVGLEYNDNITLSDHDRKQDFVVRPSLNIDSVWNISELNTMRFSLGLSYAKYFSHSEFDTRGVLLSPNSELAFSVHVGNNVIVTLRDRFSYQEDPFDIPTVSGVATFRRFENLAGLQADWDVNPSVRLTGGYNHYNLWAHDKAFQSQDRAIDTLYVRPAWKVTPQVTVGADASVSFVQYTHDVLNDGTSFLLGPYIDVAVTDNTRAYLEVGYQNFSFDDNGAIRDTEDSNTFFIKAEIDNRLTENFSHRLSFSKTTEPGYTSNFYELYHVEYGADWKLTPSVVIDPVAFYEHYETSGGNNGGFSEKADRFGAAIGMRYVLSPSLTFGADYRFILKDSNVPDNDYYQNLVLLSVFYNF